MALNPINLKQRKSGGKGGLFGKIAGSVIGGIGGALVGQPLQGAAAGGTLGGIVGGVVDPAKVSGGRGVGLSAMSGDAEVRLAQLMDAQKALINNPKIAEPEKMELQASVFTPAIDMLRKNMAMRRV